jgi:signal peptidase
MLQLTRRALELVLIVYIVGILALAAGAQIAPLVGGGLYAVRSDSMKPALVTGTLVVLERIPPESVRAGDIVTIAVGATTTVTHRVVDVIPTDSGPVFATRGDANATADPVAARADQLRGRVTWQIPLLGFLLAMLAMPSGIVALVSIGATLLTAAWLLDEVEAGDEDDELDELRRQLEADPTSVVP